MKRFVLAAVTVSVIFLIAACSVTTNTTNDHKNMNDKTLQTETATTPLKVEKGPEVTLIAKEEKQKLSNGVIVPVWTFNGSSPGSEIRVKKVKR